MNLKKKTLRLSKVPFEFLDMKTDFTKNAPKVRKMHFLKYFSNPKLYDA